MLKGGSVLGCLPSPSTLLTPFNSLLLGPLLLSLAQVHCYPLFSRNHSCNFWSSSRWSSSSSRIFCARTSVQAMCKHALLHYVYQQQLQSNSWLVAAARRVALRFYQLPLEHIIWWWLIVDGSHAGAGGASTYSGESGQHKPIWGGPWRCPWGQWYALYARRGLCVLASEIKSVQATIILLFY